MSERRFVIDDVDNAAISIITESELKRRCFEMCSIYYNTHCEFNWDRLKSVLLHGDGEKGEEPCYVCRQVGNHEPWCSRGKPSPAPTREEWEKWAREVAEEICKFPSYPLGAISAISGALLSMPIVPKE